MTKMHPDEFIAELQYEAGMYQSLYENALKVLCEINRIVHVPTKETTHRAAEQHFQADFDAIRKLTAFAVSAADQGTQKV